MSLGYRLKPFLYWLVAHHYSNRHDCVMIYTEGTCRITVRRPWEEGVMRIAERLDGLAPTDRGHNVSLLERDRWNMEADHYNTGGLNYKWKLTVSTVVWMRHLYTRWCVIHRVNILPLVIPESLSCLPPESCITQEYLLSLAPHESLVSWAKDDEYNPKTKLTNILLCNMSKIIISSESHSTVCHPFYFEFTHRTR